MFNDVKTSHQNEIKKANIETVLRLILKNNGISRSRIAKISRLSQSTITMIVDQLIEKRLINETSKPADESMALGRKPIAIEVNTDNYYIIGLEVYENGIRGGVFDLLKNELKHINIEEIDLTNNFLGKVINIVRSLIAGFSDKKFLGIGIGLPAVVDPANRLLRYSIPLHLQEINMRDEIVNAFKIPVYIESEAILSGLAENAVYMENIASLIYIMVDKGIGGCIISGYRILEGSFRSAGEIGHMSLNPDGPECICGNKGCLELYASTKVLLNNIKAALGNDCSSILYNMVNGDFSKLTISAIGIAAQKGDHIAKNEIDRLAKYLACGIANVVNILNPEVIIIGGSITALGEEFLNNVSEIVRKTALKPYTEKLVISYSHFKDSSVSYGAAHLVLEGELHQLF